MPRDTIIPRPLINAGIRKVRIPRLGGIGIMTYGPGGTEEVPVGADLDCHFGFEYICTTGDSSWFAYGYAVPVGEDVDGTHDWAAYTEMDIDDHENWYTEEDEEIKYPLGALNDGEISDGAAHNPGDKDVYIEIYTRRKNLSGAELIATEAFTESDLGYPPLRFL